MPKKAISFLTLLKKPIYYNLIYEAVKSFYASNEDYLLKGIKRKTKSIKISKLFDLKMEYKNGKITSKSNDKMVFDLSLKCYVYFSVVEVGVIDLMSTFVNCVVKCIADNNSELSNVKIIDVVNSKKRYEENNDDYVFSLSLKKDKIESQIKIGEFIDNFIKYRIDISKIKKAISNMDFYESLNYLLSMLKINKTELSINSGLSLKTIQRYLTPEMPGGNKKPEKKTAVLLLRAMNLPFEISEMCLEKASIKFVKNDVLDEAYIYSLKEMTHVNHKYVNMFIDSVDNISKRE